MSTDANASARGKTVHVFVSYAREDLRWLDPANRYNLIPYLMESLRRFDVVFWFDKDLKPGDEYKQHIQTEIDNAEIALLIVSQNFLNSEFIEQKEMPRIAERAQLGKMIVVPVLVEPCDWTDYPFLADRQMVPSSPLIDYTESDPQWAKVKYQILDGLKAQLKRIRETPKPSVTEFAKPAEPERFSAPQPVAESKPQPTVQAPPPPPPPETRPQPAVKAPPVREAARTGQVGERVAAASASIASIPRSSFARKTLALLFFLNLFNYADRSVFYGMVRLYMEEFALSSTDLGVLFVLLVVVYVVAALIVGRLGDRSRRKPLIVGAGLFFSLGTLAMTATHDNHMMLLCQALVSAGGAAFDVLALATLSDLYPERERCFAISVFCLSIPLGSALGPLAGLGLTEAYEREAPFVCCAVLGLIFAALYGWLGQEPVRGSFDRIAPTANRSTFGGLFANPAYLIAALGLATISSVVASISTAMPIFHFAVRNMTINNTVSGVAGILVGGLLAQAWLRRNDRALYQFSFWSVVLAVPFFILLVLGNGEWTFLMLFVMGFFLSLHRGPLQAAAINAVSAPIRATAIAIYLALTRLFTALVSTLFFPQVAERFGYRISLGTMLIFLVFSGAILFFGARFAPPLND